MIFAIVTAVQPSKRFGFVATAITGSGRTISLKGSNFWDTFWGGFCKPIAAPIAPTKGQTVKAFPVPHRVRGEVPAQDKILYTWNWAKAY